MHVRQGQQGGDGRPLLLAANVFERRAFVSAALISAPNSSAAASDRTAAGFAGVALSAARRATAALMSCIEIDADALNDAAKLAH